MCSLPLPLVCHKIRNPEQLSAGNEIFITDDDFNYERKQLSLLNVGIYAVDKIVRRNGG